MKKQRQSIWASLILLAFTQILAAQKPIKNIAPAPVKITGKKKVEFTPSIPTAEQPFNGQRVEVRSIQNFAKPKSLPEGLSIIYTEGGLPRQIDGILPTSFVREKTAETRALQYVAAIQKAMNIRNAAEEWTVKSVETDDLGQTHTRLQQQFGGIPVRGGMVIVHEEASEVRRMNGAYFPTPNLKSLRPQIAATAAEATVLADLKAGFKAIPTEALWQVGGQQVKSSLIIFHKDADYRAEKLAWHVTAYRDIVHRFEYFVDAQSGAIIDNYGSSCSLWHNPNTACSHENHEKSVENAENTEGVHLDKNEPNLSSTMLMDGKDSTNTTDLLGVTRKIQTYQVGTRWYLIDASRPMFKAARSTFPNNGIGVIQTFDNRNSDNGPYYNVTSTNNTWTEKTSVSAHYYSGLAYNYFLSKYNRKSINGEDGTIYAFVNVTDGGQSMENAYWNGEAMYYGNGGPLFHQLARGLDVAGHEMSHGVIQNSADLRYQSEPGALNESFADVFGSLIDRDDWGIGEDVVKNRTYFFNGLLRDMADPNNGGTKGTDGTGRNGWQPKHVNDQYKGRADNGGVHINSGIPNYAFYLIATAIGKDDAEKIYYRALTTYLNAESKFLDCRASVEQACKDLFVGNTTYLNAVQNSFFAVGIGTAGASGSTGGNAGGTAYQQNFPVNSGADFVVYATTDNTKLMLLTPSTGATVQLSNRGVYNKPSVTDDGKRVVYIANDRKMYIVTITYSGSAYASHIEQVLQNDPIWNNAAISRDGRRLAGNEGDSLVWVYNFANQTQKEFKLYNPTFTQGVNAGVVKQTDALEFDHFGQDILYDSQTEIVGGDGSSLTFWDIGILNVWSNVDNTWGTGKVEKLFSDLPDETSVANPTYAKNSAYIVAFDFIDATTATTAYYVLSANIITGKATQANTGIAETNILGYPNFTRTDNRIMFSNESLTGSYQLMTVPISATKLEPTSANKTLVKSDGQLGVWFANGTRALVSTQDLLDDKAIEVAPNPFGDNLNIQITSAETADATVEIVDLLGRIVERHPLSISVGKNQLGLSTRSLAAGTYLLKVQLGSKMRMVKVVKQ